MRVHIRWPRTAGEWLGSVSVTLLVLLALTVGTYRAAFRTPVAQQNDLPIVSATTAPGQTMLPALPTITEIQAGSQEHSDQRTFLIGVADKCASQNVYYVHATPLTPHGEYTARIRSTDGTYDSGNLVGDGATADEDGTVINLPLKCGGFIPGTYSFVVTDSSTRHTLSFKFISVLLGK